MPRKPSEYIVYDKQTDMPLVLGTAEECGRYLDMRPRRIIELAYLTKVNRIQEYEVFNLDVLLEGYDEYEDEKMKFSVDKY